MSTPTRGPKLRASYVWNGDVMQDRVMLESEPVTVGPGPAVSPPSWWTLLGQMFGLIALRRAWRKLKKITEENPLPTFVTAALGLPEKFPILRPGRSGYVLTVSNKMSGTLSLGGKKIEVSQFAVSGAGTGGEGARGAFRATAIGPGDWGVIHLDGRGEHTLFFQFVDQDPPIPQSGWRDSELLLPAVAFSVFIHAAFLAYAFYYYTQQGDGFGFPGNRELVAGYLVNRPPPLEKAEEPKAGAEDGEEKVEPSSTEGKEAKKGGEGDKPRKRAPNPDKGKPDEELPKSKMNVGYLNKRSRKAFEKVAMRGGFDRRVGDATARMIGAQNRGGPGGFGFGKGTGVGKGKGTGTTKTGGMSGIGGGGKAHQDVETTGKIDTGGKRAAKGLPSGKGVKEAQISIKKGSPSGKLGGLTKAQIRKVVLSRSRGIRACYQRALQRSGGLAGKVVIRWKITSAGKVKAARVASSTLNNGAAENCIVRQFNAMKFPSPGSGEIPVVKFPFIFSAK